MSKIILIDFGNLSKRCLYSEHCRIDETSVDYQVWRYTIFNSILSSMMKFKPSRVVLAMDDTSWRKIIYKPYKLDRRIKIANDIKSGKPMLNWEEVSDVMETFAFELSENLPIQTMKIQSCEADDIIGSISLEKQENNYIVISTDSDFKQLLKYNHIKVYDPNKKEFFICDDPDDFLQECYLRGQSKDNIYNVFTDLEFPLEGIERNDVLYKFRKPVFGEQQYRKIKDLDEWIDVLGPAEARKKNEKIIKENKEREKNDLPLLPLLNENIRSRYDLNKKLINLEYIPAVLKQRIFTKFDEWKNPDPSNFYSFFKKHGWRDILDRFSSVESTLLKLY